MNRLAWRGMAVALVAAWFVAGSWVSAQPASKPKATQKQAKKVEPRHVLSDQERTEIETRIAALRKAIAALPKNEEITEDQRADIAVYEKAASWAVQLGEFFNKKDVATILAQLDRGRERAKQLADGKKPWAEARESVIRGYRSKVDGSIQPYAVIVAPDLDLHGNERVRLDVVLHGRGDNLNEVRFIQSHDAKPAPADTQGKIVLHVFGRTNNAYRWAGETDVFEAIDAVSRNYRIDDRRIVLRGFSMGGAGAWHLGLHHPSTWSSVEAGAGFSETKNYAKLGTISDVQAKLLHIYDAEDDALNAFDVPMAGYGGENDPQKQAGINIENALKALGFTFKTEGLVTKGQGIDFIRVVGEGMGHAVDPKSAAILKAFHDEHATSGVNVTPRRVRFTTFTLKYNKAAWITIQQLVEHYERATVDAEIQGSKVVVRTADNVMMLGVERHVGETIVLGDQEFPLESAAKGLLPNVYFQHVGNAWRTLEYNESRAFEENANRLKHPNVPGPIDDAFTGSFLCVRGTGKAWNPAVQKWADSRLKQFADDWRQWMRGEVRIKNDTEVTPDDLATHSMILFGDPGSNRVLATFLKDLPITWTNAEVALGKTYPAADHAPALIVPNPFNPHRYLVVNSGQTFGAKDFKGTNALLYPRLGDHAVFQVDEKGGTLRETGFYNEKWKLR